MIPVPYDHSRHALHERLHPFIIIRKHTASVMSLNVRLLDHIESVLITQVIQIRVIRIMGGSY